MHRFFWIGLILVAVSAQEAFAQVATDRQVERLQGQVKALRLEESDVKGSPGKWQETNRIIIKTLAWDQNGFQTEEVLFGTSPFTRKSEPLIKILRTYDAGQKLRTDRQYNVRKSDPKNVMPSVIPLDAEGKPLKLPPPPPPPPKAPDGAVVDQVAYKFDAKGNLIEMVDYDGDATKGKVSSRQTYLWDEQGKLKEEAYFGSDGKLAEKTLYQYDAQGNEIEQLRLNEKGKNISHEIYSEYKFDAQGNWTQRVKQMDYVAAYGQRIKAFVITYRYLTYW